MDKCTASRKIVKRERSAAEQVGGVTALANTLFKSQLVSNPQNTSI